VSVITTFFMLRLFFVVQYGIVHFLCTMNADFTDFNFRRLQSFGYHPHPLGYLCAKFHFFRGVHCWASPWRKTA